MGELGSCDGLPGHERSGGMRVWGAVRGCLALRSVGGKGKGVCLAMMYIGRYEKVPGCEGLHIC